MWLYADKLGFQTGQAILPNRLSVTGFLIKK